MLKDSFRSRVTRRQFIQTGAAALATLSIPPTVFSCAKKHLNRGPGEVLIARDPEEATGLDTINEEIVQQVVDKAITEFTGLSDVGKAWKSIFPQYVYFAH